MAHEMHPTDTVGVLKTDCPDCKAMVQLMNLPPKYVVVYVDGGTSYLAKWIGSGGIYETVAQGKTAELKRLAGDLNNAK